MRRSVAPTVGIAFASGTARLNSSALHADEDVWKYQTGRWKLLGPESSASKAHYSYVEADACRGEGAANGVQRTEQAHEADTRGLSRPLRARNGSRQPPGRFFTVAGRAPTRARVGTGPRRVKKTPRPARRGSRAAYVQRRSIASRAQDSTESQHCKCIGGFSSNIEFSLYDIKSLYPHAYQRKSRCLRKRKLT